MRLGVSETVARPDLREVSGSSYIDPLTETRIRGNPDLVTSPIKNVDLRAEWFFENGDNFTCRCSTRTSRSRSRPCKAPAPTTTSR